jgi:crossover junction endodeoxyribonuclease RuvC
MVIIGIDPGTATTGYGIIQNIENSGKNKSKRLKMVSYGCIKTKPDTLVGDRLKIIHKELSSLIKIHKPELISIESLYFFVNLKTALPVSQARGVILFTAAKYRVPVLEFTPLQMKLTVTGYGKSEKEVVQKQIQKILQLKECPKPDDAADALGMAICGALKFNSGKK